MNKLERLVAEIRKIAAERPDTVYAHSDCFYDSGECSDGSVGCLIGQALKAIYWDLYEDNENAGISELLRDAGYQSCAVTWCLRVQLKQDSGETWGSSVNYADLAGEGDG